MSCSMPRWQAWVYLFLCGVCPAEERQHGVISPIVQAWRQWCSLKEHKCMHQVSIPQKAYVISLPTDSEKREHVLPPIQALGLEPEIVDGIMENQVNSSIAISECAAWLQEGFTSDELPSPICISQINCKWICAKCSLVKGSQSVMGP